MTILDKMMVALGFQVDDSGLQKFENRAASVRDSALSLANVVGGVLTGAFAELFKSFVDTSAEFEKYSVVLGVLYDNVDQGRHAMDWISEFAVKTPYQLADLTQAFIRLKAFGLDPTQGALKTVGDTAAAFGRPLMDAVFAMDDAIEGINRPLRTFGISVKEKGDQVTYSYIKNGQEIHKTISKTNKLVVAATLQAIWNDRYGGAMDKLSYTWSGMWSNMLDQLTRFKQKVMSSGPFTSIKAVLGQVIAIIDKAVSDGTAEKFAAYFNIGFQAVYRTLRAAYWALDEVISHTVGWRVALSALAVVATGILATAIGNTISLIAKLTSTVLAFDAASLGIFLIAGALVLVIDDIYNYYKGNASLIGQLQTQFPYALEVAYAAVVGLIAGFVALKWATITSLVETMSIMALYAVDWGIAAAAAVAAGAEIVVSAAATAVGWIASFGSMAIATLAATWPILAIIAALVLVSGAVILLMRNWQRITNAMAIAWRFVIDEIKEGVQWIIDNVSKLGKIGVNFIRSSPNAASLISSGMRPDSGANPAASFMSNSVNAGGGVIGRAGSNINNSTSQVTHTSKTEIHAPITIVSSDPETAGSSVQRTLDQKRRQVVRNGQSAVAY